MQALELFVIYFNTTKNCWKQEGQTFSDLFCLFTIKLVSELYLYFLVKYKNQIPL